MVVNLIPVQVCSWANMIRISNHRYLPNLDQPRIVCDFKRYSTVGVVPSMLTLIIFISAHIQPSKTLHGIYIVDYEIVDHFILVGWFLYILNFLRQSLIVVLFYSPLDIQPPYMCNAEDD